MFFILIISYYYLWKNEIIINKCLLFVFIQVGYYFHFWIAFTFAIRPGDGPVNLIGERICVIKVHFIVRFNSQNQHQDMLPMNKQFNGENLN